MNNLRLAATLALSMAGVSAHAFPIADAGTEGLVVIVANTGHVFATYEGNSASYSNDLLLNGNFIFNNHNTPEGTVADLGEFTAGTELKFELFVHDTNTTFSIGPAARNPDGHEHARVQANWAPGATLVSFEDLTGGPYDYNDLSFSFTNTRSAVPEAGSVALLAAGLGLVAALGRRRKS
ncbi:MAG: PEP-CTERM sorting domain-containing protein [Rubrivivax sp.]|nr:MAG: PEP-CTERM sorting domain-containing protein [Rubrivivax sp.]